jgi:hypothetical protein
MPLSVINSWQTDIGGYFRMHMRRLLILFDNPVYTLGKFYPMFKVYVHHGGDEASREERLRAW